MMSFYEFSINCSKLKGLGAQIGGYPVNSYDFRMFPPSIADGSFTAVLRVADVFGLFLYHWHLIETPHGFWRQLHL
jgi:hypothetical protein